MTANSQRESGTPRAFACGGVRSAVVRRFDPAAGGFTYTRLGRQFFSRRRTEYVVSVPARFTGTRTNGNAYTRDGLYPIRSTISLPQSLTAQQRDRRIKRHVEESFPDGFIAEYSEETVKLREGAWSIVEMTTSPSADGPVTAVTDRRLGVSPVACSLLFPEHITPSAFEQVDDRMCVPRQIAHITGAEFGSVCEALDVCENKVYGTCVWRSQGCTSKMIFEYARQQDLGAVCLHNDTVIETLAGRRPLTFAVLGAHAYFYDNPQVARMLAKRRPHDFERLKREPAQTKAPDASEWIPLPDLREGLPDAGFYYVPASEIDTVRGQFLSTGRHPKCILRDVHVTKALKYTFVRGKDLQKAPCISTQCLSTPVSFGSG